MKHLLACLAILAAFNVTAQVDGFQLPYNPDSEPDGYIGVGDILEVLSIFGSQFSPDDIYTNDDSTHVVLDIGTMTYFECLAQCNQLEGSWRVTTKMDIGYAWQGLANGSYYLNSEASPANNCFLCSYSLEKTSSTSLIAGPSGTQNISDSPTCLCATQERPRVEYTYCEGSNIQNCASDKVADGWYPLDLTSHHRHPGEDYSGATGSGYQWKVQAFWRWAD